MSRRSNVLPVGRLAVRHRACPSATVCGGCSNLAGAVTVSPSNSSLEHDPAPSTASPSISEPLPTVGGGSHHARDAREMLRERRLVNWGLPWPALTRRCGFGNRRIRSRARSGLWSNAPESEDDRRAPRVGQGLSASGGCQRWSALPMLRPDLRSEPSGGRAASSATRRSIRRGRDSNPRTGRSR
jgi:hypothetical protein